jgi:uncharacterized protein (DUF2336 family)
MSTLISFVSEVEEAVASGDSSRRMQSLRKMTDLFVEQAPKLNDEHVSVFDEVILRLARDMEFRARVELSDRLADVENAPLKVVQDLALDDNIDVAKPILERSARLSDELLVAVAEQKGQDHLLAISQRPTLSERITDVLVDRGDQRVVRSVATNQGARFSESGLVSLVEKASADTELRSALQKRSELSPDRLRQLIALAREKAAENMKAELGGDSSRLEAALGQAAASMSQGGTAASLVGDLSAALKRVADLARDDTIDDAKLGAWIKTGKLDESLAALAHLASVPVDMVSRAYHAASYDPLLVIVRAARLNWNTFKLLLTCKAGRLPPVDVLKSSFESFQKLSVPTAQRVARFTAAREAAKSDAA